MQGSTTSLLVLKDMAAQELQAQVYHKWSVYPARSLRLMLLLCAEELVQVVCAKKELSLKKDEEKGAQGNQAKTPMEVLS